MLQVKGFVAEGGGKVDSVPDDNLACERKIIGGRVVIGGSVKAGASSSRVVDDSSEGVKGSLIVGDAT